MKQSMEVLTSMNTGEWYTPGWYLDKVREVFNAQIDLDPASDPIANQTVKARRIYSLFEDGLTQDWVASNLFLNPPYSSERYRVATTATWIRKASSEWYASSYPQGIWLVNAKLGYKWFNGILDNTNYVTILHRQRIGFVEPATMEAAKPSRQPQATVYVGIDPSRFLEVFGDLGWPV